MTHLEANESALTLGFAKARRIPFSVFVTHLLYSKSLEFTILSTAMGVVRHKGL